MNVWFEMCVNDYDGYGQHTGRLHAAQFQSDERELHIQCTWDDLRAETICRRESVSVIRVGRRKFPILQYVTYVGNMMWDAALVTPEVANQIAAVLRATGKYEPTDGTTELWEAWEDSAPMFSEQEPPDDEPT